MSQTAPDRRAIIVGAGIVGVCSALYLQREGFQVTLLDRDGPGEGCSAGNAGGIAVGTYPEAGILRKVPGMLRDPLHPLFIRWPDLPRLLPWFLRFAANASPSRVAAISRAIDGLHGQVLEAYGTLLAEAGAEALVERTGMYFVYESRPAFEAGNAARDNYRRRGADLEDLDGDRMREVEPALGPRVKYGIHLKGSAHTVNPLRLTRTLADHFVSRGGTLLRETVRGFEAREGTPRVVTDAGTHASDAVVIAAGAWSASLVAQLGSRVPLAAERGYHVMLPEPGVAVRRPMRLYDRYVVVTPMEHGLRLSGIAEFASLDAPPDWSLADVLLRQTRAVIPGLRTDGMTRWMGNRPSTPDSIPVIGRSPRHPAVYFAFGHCHSGLSLAAVTGKLIGELAAGRRTSLDLSPFRPDRF